jgi:hypothetical protein
VADSCEYGDVSERSGAMELVKNLFRVPGS